MPIIPAPTRLRREDLKFKTNLNKIKFWEFHKSCNLDPRPPGMPCIYLSRECGYRRNTCHGRARHSLCSHCMHGPPKGDPGGQEDMTGQDKRTWPKILHWFISVIIWWCSHHCVICASHKPCYYVSILPIWPVKKCVCGGWPKVVTVHLSLL